MGNTNTNLLNIPNPIEVCEQYSAVQDNNMKNSLSFLKECTTHIDGAGANSASASDILFLDDGTGNRMVMKYFLTNNPFLAAGQPNPYEPMVYELEIYADKIRPLVKQGVCPYFVDFYGGSLDVSYQQMLEFLSVCVQKSAAREKTNRLGPGFLPNATELDNLSQLISYTFRRNILYMLTKTGARPSMLDRYVAGTRESIFTILNGVTALNLNPGGTIDRIPNMIIAGAPMVPTPTINLDQTILSEPTNEQKFNNSKFGFLITKMERSNTFDQFIRGGHSDNTLRAVIFQICIAHYALYLSGISHNDAHSSNIFIEDLGVNTQFNYFIENKRYDFVTRYIPKIYDFDRGYHRRTNVNDVKNFTLEDIGINRAGQANALINGKDFMKSICYFLRYRRPTLAGVSLSNTLRDILVKGTLNQKQDRITRMGADRMCFFEDYAVNTNNLLNTQAQYDLRFYTYREMLESMGNAFGYTAPEICQDNYQFITAAGANRRVYYLHQNIFDNNKNIDSKNLKLYIGNVANVCVQKCVNQAGIAVNERNTALAIATNERDVARAALAVAINERDTARAQLQAYVAEAGGMVDD